MTTWADMLAPEPSHGHALLQTSEATVAHTDGGDGSIVLTPSGQALAIHLVAIQATRSQAALTAATPVFSSNVLTGFTCADYTAFSTLGGALSSGLTLGIDRWASALWEAGTHRLPTGAIGLPSTADSTAWDASTVIDGRLYRPLVFAAGQAATFTLTRPATGSVTWTVSYYEALP